MSRIPKLTTKNTYHTSNIFYLWHLSSFFSFSFVCAGVVTGVGCVGSGRGVDSKV